MRSRQRGITLIGWLVLLVPLAVVVYAGIRVTPIYLNYMKVVRTLDQVADEYKNNADAANAATLRNSIDKHFDIDMVEYPTTKDIKIAKDGRAWVIEANYDDQAPLFSNIFLLITFDKIVRIGNAATD
ncbi:MAG TPA: DUF4845 domain-containing protein [Steroidobacteraceae bacterium]|nr:DUF4845 domain-containing protein [Steroidobacteraceae bacterium]